MMIMMYSVIRRSPGQGLNICQNNPRCLDRLGAPPLLSSSCQDWRTESLLFSLVFMKFLCCPRLDYRAGREGLLELRAERDNQYNNCFPHEPLPYCHTVTPTHSSPSKYQAFQFHSSRQYFNTIKHVSIKRFRLTATNVFRSGWTWTYCMFFAKSCRIFLQQILDNARKSGIAGMKTTSM